MTLTAKHYCLSEHDVMYSGRSNTEVSEEPAASATRLEEISSSTLTLEAAHPSATSVDFHQTTCHHISEDC